MVPRSSACARRACISDETATPAAMASLQRPAALERHPHWLTRWVTRAALLLLIGGSSAAAALSYHGRGWRHRKNAKLTENGGQIARNEERFAPGSGNL